MSIIEHFKDWLRRADAVNRQPFDLKEAKKLFLELKRDLPQSDVFGHSLARANGCFDVAPPSVEKLDITQRTAIIAIFDKLIADVRAHVKERILAGQ